MWLAAQVIAGLVAALHAGFFVLEAVLWTKPTGRKVFAMSKEDAARTATLAANQGVYNLMLAVGIGWALAVGNVGALGFLLAFVVAVGLYGAYSVSRTILVVQALPAALALGLLLGA
jgi:putative membrane protein